MKSFPKRVCRFGFWVTVIVIGLTHTSAMAEKTAGDVKGDWGGYVTQCLDTLIEYGTDRYGEKETPLMMAVIDVRTLESPKAPETLDSIVRLEGRIHRRAERGSNMWYDQGLIRSMYRLSEVTKDKKYAQAADDYIDYFFKNCYKSDDGKNRYRNGMPSWGTHIFWDCYEERPAGDGDGDNGPHEVLVYHPEWSDFYRINPDATKKWIDGIWQGHIVNKNSGLHNRHDDQQVGCDFAFSGGTFAQAFAFMYAMTKEQEYLDKAKLIANWHWQHRNKETNLAPDCTSTGDRYDAHHCMTSVTGPHVSQLLRAYELSGVDEFRDIACAYVKAYDKYGWDEDASNYFGMLKLDGTPVLGGVELDINGDPIPGATEKDTSNYGAWAPAGYVDLWRTSIYSYEFPMVAAQAAVYAYEMSGSDDSTRDEELLTAAKHWATVIEKNLPAHTGRRWKRDLEAAMPAARKSGGTYAENYGRAISFFVHLYRATGDPQYLERASEIAQDAVDKLFENGIFKGHPAKPYYEATNGVGLLLYALLELDAPGESLRGAF